jgi:hypothetical protein
MKKRTHNKTHRGHRAKTEPAKGLVLPSGMRLSHGQLFEPQEGNPMSKLNSPKASAAPGAPHPGEGMARTGAAKHIVAAPPVFGQKRATEGPLHPHLHGQSQDDSVPRKSFDASTPIKIHDGMTEKQRAAIDTVTANNPHAILGDAARLGRK